MSYLRYLVISDVHWDSGNIERLLKDFHKEIDGVIFAGDGLEIVRRFQSKIPRLFLVEGNVDGRREKTPYRVFKLGGISVFLTHGDHFKVKSGLTLLKKKTRKPGYNLVIFGHTHQPYYRKEEQAVYFNPGALIDGNYGVLHIYENEFYLEHQKLQ
jgi:putative phosphoesterase